ncbi:MAG: polysaccharide deacetylase family protein [Candidatus Omnitrophota bacterium]
MLDKGTFIISIDTELAWGTFDHGGHKKYKEAYEKYRFIISQVLKLFEKYDIPATWAIVGHLFLDSCHREDGVIHPDIVRPRHQWFGADWFSLDPVTDISSDQIWYGSDIVKMIKEAYPKQEIASHSFCHPVFSDKGCSKETAESDIAKCVRLALNEGIELRSFIFPRNLPGHLDILSKYGFKVFRGQGDRYCPLKLPQVIKKMYFLLDDMVATTPPTVLPKAASNNGLIEVPASMLFRFAYGKSRIIAEGMRFRKAKKGIDAAIKRRRIFHLWFHPISFAWKMNLMLAELDAILQYASEKKKDGLLEIATLKEDAGCFMMQGARTTNLTLRQSVCIITEAQYSKKITLMACPSTIPAPLSSAERR